MKNLTLVSLLFILLACEKEKPTVNFEVTKEKAGIGEIVNFINLTDNADHYEWSFGDGNTSTEISPSYKFSEVGNYAVCLKATKEEEASKTLNLEIVKTRINIGDSHDRVIDLYGVDNCFSMTYDFGVSAGKILKFCDPDITFTFDNGDPMRVTSIDFN